MIGRFAFALAIGFATSHSSAQEIVPPAVRDVTPPGVTPGPSGEGPLIREAVPPPPPEPPRWRRFFLPATTDAATFVIDRTLTVRVSGVSPPAVEETCTFADGEMWPCGRTALYALRMFLGGRAIECYFPPLDGASEVVAPCRVGGTDLGGWLLQSGWARPGDLATSEYAAAATVARCAGKGMWRGYARPDYCPEEPAALSEESAASAPLLPD